jgi:hypothetical protein
MSRYGRQEQSINSTSNMIRLKVDVHQLFDRKPRLAIVPKYDTMVAHIFDAEDAVEAVELYHNVPLQDLDRVRIELLFARMAWTVFPHLSMFLSARRKRKVLRLGTDNEWQAQELSGDQCSKLYGQTPKSRSSSPRKRTAAQATGEGDEPQEEYVEQDDQHEDEDHADWQRGRKRRRSLDHFYPDSFASRTPSSEELLRSDSEASESVELRSLQTE